MPAGEKTTEKRSQVIVAVWRLRELVGSRARLLKAVHRDDEYELGSYTVSCTAYHTLSLSLSITIVVVMLFLDVKETNIFYFELFT